MINLDTGLSDNPAAAVMFSVYNSLERRYCAPILFMGPAALSMARRCFANALAQLPPTLQPSDLSLWIVGEFDTDTGAVTALAKPLDCTLLPTED